MGLCNARGVEMRVIAQIDEYLGEENERVLLLLLLLLLRD